ncbi:DUF2975 domain-containing protein [Desulfosporosinus lacus]|uniref:DUF2975 domain-containing protein n=1 Tax=Desulfosporosinus lacus DSM 15449 TaxID=1121420 RepID=A0A1M6H0R2_9FIRM|nr:DUF2975 domain-containing protein [Desulfosporosinus lacus]SHJ15714.1 Protein of unknown function [Desulfosporosinus lacus DSM 15449]
MVFSIIASPERFTAVKGNLNWRVSYNLSNSSSFFIDIPYKIMQPIYTPTFSAKYAIISSLFSILIKVSITLFGLYQVVDILKSTLNDLTPFIMDNVKRLKKLAYSIIVYSVVADILSSILFSTLVTRVYMLNLSNIHLSGVLVGGLILVIADIFKYGVYLQNEFDTTL